MFNGLFLLCSKYFLSPIVNSLVSDENKKCMRECVVAPHNLLKLLLEGSYSTLLSDVGICLARHFGINCLCPFMYLEYKIGLLNCCCYRTVTFTVYCRAKRHFIWLTLCFAVGIRWYSWQRKTDFRSPAEAVQRATNRRGRQHWRGFKRYACRRNPFSL